MNFILQEVEDLSWGKVTFYTVKNVNDELSELEKFDEKEFPDHENEKGQLYAILNEIARRGARAHYFKFEGSFHALPRVSEETKNENENDFGLRLYCLYLTNELVILYNGDIKTHINPEKCKSVNPHFQLAKKITEKLDKAYRDKDIDYQKPQSLSNYQIEL